MINLAVPVLNIKERFYLPTDFSFKTWEDLQPYFIELTQRSIHSVEDLEKWLADRNELEDFISEDGAWRYINFTRNTEDAEIRETYLFFVNSIKPHIAPFANTLDKQLVDSPYRKELQGDAFRIYLRSTENDIALYREENIPLMVKVEEKAQRYAEIQSQMLIRYNDEDYTLQQAAKFLQDPNRSIRKEVYNKIVARRAMDVSVLDSLFDELVSLRHEIAVNAGFLNYRDYKFKALGRFDYTLEDVHDFHRSVREYIVPLAVKILKKKSADLNLSVLEPYDIDADPPGKTALVPYEDSADLIRKSISTFQALHPTLGRYIEIMNEKGLLDLDSRKGKAPGGYNYPLDESGLAFIFMNASGKLRDMVTMMHEGGHAVHSFLTRDLHLSAFKHTPSEVAELASMSMELLTLEHWSEFFPKYSDHTRAKQEHLQGIIESLPWIATVDKFQQWVYTNSNHTASERHEAWKDIFLEFHPEGVDWGGYIKHMGNGWQRQLHIYEVPFYYIEYGIAQLGALGVWKNYKEDPQAGLQNYLDALKLGYTKGVPEIYEKAGIRFDFSGAYIQELAEFVSAEIESLKAVPEQAI